MTTFDRAWALLKDFTTDPLYDAKNTTGGFYVHDSPNRVFQPNERFHPSPWDGPKTKQFEGEDYQQGSSKARGFRATGGRVNDYGLHRLVAAHLPNILNEQEREHGQYDEQRVMDRIIEVLRHEWGHATTMDEINEEMGVNQFQGMRRKPQSQLMDEAQALGRAHEYGAYVAQGLTHDEIQPELERRGYL